MWHRKLILYLVMTVGGFALYAAAIHDDRDTNAAKNDPPVTLSQIKLDTKHNDYHLGTYWFVRDDFTIHNTSIHDIKDVVIVCAQFGKSNTEITRDRKTIYEHVPALNSVTVNEVEMGNMDEQTAYYLCRVERFTVDE